MIVRFLAVVLIVVVLATTIVFRMVRKPPQ